jgi:hypothetical protein
MHISFHTDILYLQIIGCRQAVGATTPPIRNEPMANSGEHSPGTLTAHQLAELSITAIPDVFLVVAETRNPYGGCFRRT